MLEVIGKWSIIDLLRGNKMIYPLFDPSIKPIQITDLEGNLIRVQTYFIRVL